VHTAPKALLKICCLGSNISSSGYAPFFLFAEGSPLSQPVDDWLLIHIPAFSPSSMENQRTHTV